MTRPTGRLLLIWGIAALVGASVRLVVDLSARGYGTSAPKSPDRVVGVGQAPGMTGAPLTSTERFAPSEPIRSKVPEGPVSRAPDSSQSDSNPWGSWSVREEEAALLPIYKEAGLEDLLGRQYGWVATRPAVLSHPTFRAVLSSRADSSGLVEDMETAYQRIQSSNTRHPAQWPPGNYAALGFAIGDGLEVLVGDGAAVESLNVDDEAGLLAHRAGATFRGLSDEKKEALRKLVLDRQLAREVYRRKAWTAMKATATRWQEAGLHARDVVAVLGDLKGIIVLERGIAPELEALLQENERLETSVREDVTRRLTQ